MNDKLLEFLALTRGDPLAFTLGAYPWGEPGTVLENSDGPEEWACDLMNRIRDGLTDINTAIQEAVASGHGIAIAGGPLAAGGSWFYNAVGVVQVPTGNTVTDRFNNPVPEMAPAPGVWARIRFNGDTPTLPQMLAIWRANGVTIYELFQPEGQAPFWSSDGGQTPAPDWVQNVGVIA